MSRRIEVLQVSYNEIFAMESRLYITDAGEFTDSPLAYAEWKSAKEDSVFVVTDGLRPNYYRAIAFSRVYSDDEETLVSHEKTNEFTFRAIPIDYITWSLSDEEKRSDEQVHRFIRATGSDY